MKKTLYNILSVMAVAVACFVTVACEEKPAPVETTPVFPELVTNHDVVPGEELTLTIQPNMAWSISIPKESYQWFKILNGKSKLQTISGVPMDEPKEITIWTTDEESFDLRSCDVKMTVGKETKVIASYTLRAKDKALEVYRASKLEDGSFVISSDGYVYEETPVASTDEIELVWNENEKKFYFPIKVSANYEWTVQWPSWALADIDAQSKVGNVSFEVYGIASELPLEDATGEIKFMNGTEVMKTFKVKIPGCKDIMEYNIGGYTTLTFDHAQYFHGGTGTVSIEPVSGLLYGPSGVRMIVLELAENGYYQPETPWLNAVLSSWDSIEGASVLQTREISISAPKYVEKTDRKALILFLPATAPADIAEIMTSDKMGVKEEYAAYAVNVIQTACPDEYFTFEASAEDMENAGLIFERSESPILPNLNLNYVEGLQDWQYNISYVKEMASAKSSFYITYPYETISVYDAEGVEIATDKLAEHWLSYNALNDGLYGQIVMDMTKFTENKPQEIDGYLIFKDEVGKVLAAVHCFYKEEIKTEEDVLVDVSRSFFVDPAAATAAGATIHLVQSGPTYELYKGHQAPIYKVKFTVDNTSLSIKTNKSCTSYSCMGKPEDGPELVTIDDQVYKDKELYALIDKYHEDMELYREGKLDKEPKYPDTSMEKSTYGLLKFGPTALYPERTYPGYSKFNMKKVAEKPELTSEIIQFMGGSESSVMFIFICELDIPATSEN